MSTSRKAAAVAVLALASALFVSCKNGSTDADSEAAAKVGSREITVSQIDSVIKQQIAASGAGGPLSPAELVAARLSVLNNLIQEEALYQKAQKENLVPDDNKVTQEIQRRKQQAGLTEEQYQNEMKQAGVTEQEFRDKVKRELAIGALKDRENARINPPTEEEIKKYFEENRAQFVAERGADISIVATDPLNNGAVDDAIGEAQAEQKIKAIHEQLKSGADFATIASQRSEDPSAIRSGNVGFGSESALTQTFPTRPDIPKRLMAMSPGQYTEPIKDNLSGRWYIIKVNSKIEQTQNLNLENPQVRKTIVDTITQQRQQILLNALLMVATAEASVKNYLAERIVQNPKTIVELRPSPLLEASGASGQTQQQPQQRFEESGEQSGSAQPEPQSGSDAGAPAKPKE